MPSVLPIDKVSRAVSYLTEISVTANAVVAALEGQPQAQALAQAVYDGSESARVAARQLQAMFKIADLREQAVALQAAIARETAILSG